MEGVVNFMCNLLIFYTQIIDLNFSKVEKHSENLTKIIQLSIN